MSLNEATEREEFVDTGEAWEGEKIKRYDLSSVKGGHYNIFHAFYWHVDNGIGNFFESMKELDRDYFIALPPYVGSSSEWEELLKAIEDAGGFGEEISELVDVIEGKIEIMQAREAFMQGASDTIN